MLAAFQTEILLDTKEVLERERSKTSLYIVKYESMWADIEGERERMYLWLGLNPKVCPLTDLHKLTQKFLTNFSLTDRKQNH